MNTVEAIWSKSKNEVTKEQHSEFYQYIAQAWDEPRYALHFNTDAPIAINSILYVPQVIVSRVVVPQE